MPLPTYPSPTSHPLIHTSPCGHSYLPHAPISPTQLTHPQDLRVYLLARKPSSPGVTSLIAECQKLCPAGDFITIKCADLALIKEVDGACEEILTKEKGEKGKGKVDFLCMSQGYLTFEKRKGEFLFFFAFVFFGMGGRW